MLRVAIVEDSAGDRIRLRSYLEKFSGECDETIRITEFFDGTSFLESYQSDYDLILLDIEMPHLINGMETAQELRLRDARVLHIFITNVAQYARNGYEVDALDYMIKPVNYYAFALKLKRCGVFSESRQGKFDASLYNLIVVGKISVNFTKNQLNIERMLCPDLRAYVL